MVKRVLIADADGRRARHPQDSLGPRSQHRARSARGRSRASATSVTRPCSSRCRSCTRRACSRERSASSRTCMPPRSRVPRRSERSPANSSSRRSADSARSLLQSALAGAPGRRRGDRRDSRPAGSGAEAGAVVSVGWEALEHPWLVALGWLVILSLFATALPALALAAWRFVRAHRPSSRPVRRRGVRVRDSRRADAFALPLLLVVPSLAEPTRATRVQARSTPSLPRATSVGPTGGEHDAVRAPASASGSASSAFASVPPAVLGLVAIAWSTGVVLLLVRLLLAWTAANRSPPTRDPDRSESAARDLRAPECRCRRPGHEPGRVDRGRCPGRRRRSCAGGPRARASPGVHAGRRARADPGSRTHPCGTRRLRRQPRAVRLRSLHVPQPAIWWIGARIREAREFCCDDVSVDVAGDTRPLCRGAHARRPTRHRPARPARRRHGRPSTHHPCPSPPRGRTHHVHADRSGIPGHRRHRHRVRRSAFDLRHGVTAALCAVARCPAALCKAVLSRTGFRSDRRAARFASAGCRPPRLTCVEPSKSRTSRRWRSRRCGSLGCSRSSPERDEPS